MPEKTLHVELIAHTPLPEQVCALGAKLCYAKADVAALRERVSAQDQSAFLDRIMQSGHLSVLEHASFTFAVEGVSRVLLAQLTRHRLASFSVQSQRYVSLAENFSYIVPPAIKALGEEAEARFRSQMEQMQAWYVEWQSALGAKGESSNEDARFVLPNACETRLIVTMNTRELLHFFELRCCRRAQWEIRALATEMLRLCKQAAPTLFANAGPGCVRGACPEGTKTCGNAAAVREAFKNL
ncbi:MAG: FAD-dependent thymidylate synthase [Clostridia bacterium]|nr:FAD-dependent thymidylate synthase [Clostridia bacterium]